MFNKGDRVNTPLGPGLVNYLRMDHLGDLTKIAAVSVLLDSRVLTDFYDRYSGTIFPATDVTPRRAS